MTKRGARGYGPELRVRRKAEYTQTFERGVSVRDGLLKLVAARSPAAGGPSRLGTAVSRRVGDAVARNRTRRRLREAFRLIRGELPSGLDLVVIPLDVKREPKLEQLQKSLVALAKKGLKRLEERERKPAAPPATGAPPSAPATPIAPPPPPIAPPPP